MVTSIHSNIQTVHSNICCMSVDSDVNAWHAFTHSIAYFLTPSI